MKRLGYIRLLYQQAVTQSHSPAPLNFSSVLSFHDVLEYFFIVAVDHLGNPQGLSLGEKFVTNIRKLRAPDGDPPSSIQVINRIGDVRNRFKHHGSIPGPEQVEDARRDATMFLEGNCRRLFGIEFSDISMVHIVPQDPVRNHLVAGRSAADADDLPAAMAEVALAFDRLISDWAHRKYVPGTAFQKEAFLLDASSYRPPRRRIETFPGPSDEKIRQATSSLASSVKSAFAEVDKELETVRDLLRAQIAGIDMGGYVRFSMIAPRISVAHGGHRSALHGRGKLHYTSENYDLCEMFVVDSALRIGHRDFKLWMPETDGDWDQAREAMAANGGRLPDDVR